ncbi:MAG: EI24 domain-containing protein [Oligoflexia bacterium]|nr:EI24 domain-containing protein [Oligoflexia bacterium]
MASSTRPLLGRLQSLRIGILLPLTAAKLIISERVLLFWSLLPLLITTGIYTWALGSLRAGVKSAWLRFFLTWGWDPNGLLADAVLLFSNVLVFLIGAFTFSIVAGIVASPFNDLLAEKTEPRAEPALPAVPPQPLSAKFRLVWIDILKSLAMMAATVFALLFSWVPVLNLLAIALALLLMTFQYISYPQTRRGVGLRAGAAFLWRHAYACVGFGASISLLYALPLLSITALPIAVVGGTLLVARAQAADRPSLR